jgi:NTP pyrophosphatase (non-canonical NTP hydrolase)
MIHTAEKGDFDIHPDQLSRNKMMSEVPHQRDRGATLETYIWKVAQWHRNRNLIKGSTDKDQVLKLLQELGELSDSICKGKDISDDIGDMLVVMINIVERNNLSLTRCLQEAWIDIKDRKGKMVDGIFVKEEDLP